MNRPSINLDAQWLRAFVEAQRETLGLADQARLLAIANNVERLDEIASRPTSSDFDRGVLEGERRVYARSNFNPAPVNTKPKPKPARPEPEVRYRKPKPQPPLVKIDLSALGL